MAKVTLETLFDQQHQDLKEAQEKLRACEDQIKEQVDEVEKLKQQLEEAQEKLGESQNKKINLLMAITGKTREDIINYLETVEEELTVLAEKTLTPSSKDELEKKALTLSNLSTRIITSKENIPFGAMIEDAVAEKATANIGFANELLDALKEGAVPGDATVSKIDSQLDEFIKNSADVLDHTKEVVAAPAGGVEITGGSPATIETESEVSMAQNSEPTATPTPTIEVATEADDLTVAPRTETR